MTHTAVKKVSKQSLALACSQSLAYSEFLKKKEKKKKERKKQPINSDSHVQLFS
jgi:hypothetical protein